MKKDWIKRLPPGEYTMDEVLNFSGLSSRPSAKIILLKYGADVKRVKSKSSNYFVDIFIWNGFKNIKKS